jgi:AcrR family transcriptional regulator
VTEGKPLRADARRNRARVLEVAEAVFERNGTSVSTEEIARAAGVGIGTVFRHFPTKESLLEAVYIGLLRQLADEAAALAIAEDPGEALFGFFARVVDRSAAKNALHEALAHAGVDVRSAAAEVRRDMTDAIGVLLARAQESGAVRADIGTPEFMATLVGASRAVEHAADRSVKADALTIVLDGLRERG